VHHAQHVVGRACDRTRTVARVVVHLPGHAQEGGIGGDRGQWILQVVHHDLGQLFLLTLHTQERVALLHQELVLVRELALHASKLEQ
jgi:hypothetical protein